VVRHVAPFGHIILILSQQVFVLSFSLIPGQAVKTNFMVLGLTITRVQNPQSTAL